MTDAEGADWWNESGDRLRAYIEHAPRKMWATDTVGRVRFFNREWRDYAGLAPMTDISNWKDIVHPDDQADLVRIRNEGFARGARYDMHVRLRRACDLMYRWHSVSVSPVPIDGRVVGWIGAAGDIHDERELQERQRLMAQEISHRVKNSLSLVAALLSMQARDAEDEASRKVLMDAYSRVQTIADVHAHLWRQSDSSITNIGAFLEELCLRLAETAPEHEISFAGGRIMVPTDRAIPLGLMLNELVTNALKYAYPHGKGGPIAVVLHDRTEGGPESGRVVLEVADRGVGLPEGFDIHARGQSLGMRLIANIARQLDATVTVASADPGARFSISIPRRPA
ncbi:sensor histidine kinase [Edaphosphingomonas haloaromaticamans]|uniref:histidine kinase n=1 Tax=Edaphosphingomonas haloaromaticamans TaxID=653954 RepID=A0A1S1H9Z1_9SPHN|nr:MULTISPECIES: histidine kinase dimerization/phosphoacceptor domain -containing protein [Sphingomonas]MDX3883763.1 histidine kinase dimerization/phosphoacceptor domain -containing protein [Sphingomonas sp.]OHT19009.1 putative sensor histidine kinase pdtaS [Sphingomonas haloaromaticamans]